MLYLHDKLIAVANLWQSNEAREPTKGVGTSDKGDTSPGSADVIQSRKSSIYKRTQYLVVLVHKHTLSSEWPLPTSAVEVPIKRILSFILSCRSEFADFFYMFIPTRISILRNTDNSNLGHTLKASTAV